MADQTISEKRRNKWIRRGSSSLSSCPGFLCNRSPCLKLAGNSKQGGCHKLCDDDVFALSKCLHSNRTVTALDLSYNNVGDRGAGHLADLLEVGNQEEVSYEPGLVSRGDSALLYLDLTFNNIGAKGAELLSLSLVRNMEEALLCSGTPLLYLVQGYLVSARSKEISRPLRDSAQFHKACSQSQVMGLQQGHETKHTARKFPLSQKGQRHWTEKRCWKRHRILNPTSSCDLCSNRVSHDGALYLASVLKEKTAIEILNLSINCIEDIGAGYLSDAMSRLSVCTNNIRTQGLCSLAQALKNNPTLTHLYIWGNHPKEPACRAFRELISSGRLPPQNTDVESYEQDGHVFLAEAFHGLRKSLYQADGNVTDATVGSASDGPPEDQPQR
uniref:Leucine rich repeat containing 34 n=1 Tax=Cyprinodon variegatus TaxID=28743 RepID=A0A3Q2D4D0_CYPVA